MQLVCPENSLASPWQLPEPSAQTAFSFSVPIKLFWATSTDVFSIVLEYCEPEWPLLLFDDSWWDPERSIFLPVSILLASVRDLVLGSFFRVKSLCFTSGRLGEVEEFISTVVTLSALKSALEDSKLIASTEVSTTVLSFITCSGVSLLDAIVPEIQRWNSTNTVVLNR